MDTRELLLQTTRTRPPHALEAFVRLAGADESHLYVQGLTLADFCAFFAREVRPLDVLIYRMPPDLLNANYWQPMTKEAENAVREKLGGIVARNEGDRALLWRADHVAKGRLLRDGLDVPTELLQGYIFRTTGEGLTKLAAAWNGRDRFEWAGLGGSIVSEYPPDVLGAVHADVAQMRRGRPNEVFLYASQDDDAARVVFSDRDHLLRAIEALVRGFVHNLTQAHVGNINRRICDQLARLADGHGLSATPEHDFTDKGRTCEIRARVGRTLWGASPRPGEPPLSGDERVFIYYDRVNGLWAVAT